MPVPIIADGAVATTIFGSGKFVPVLILLRDARPDLAELIRVHQHTPPGDVRVQWGRDLGGSRDVILLLTFDRPIELQASIRFNIEKQGKLVDLILQSSAVYLQAGVPGDRLSGTMDQPRICVEIPDTGFQPVWDAALHKSLMKRFRRGGLPTAAARSAATDLINEWRTLACIRVQDD